MPDLGVLVLESALPHRMSKESPINPTSAELPRGLNDKVALNTLVFRLRPLVTGSYQPRL